MMSIDLDYSKPETVSCQLESVMDYLSNYNETIRSGDLRDSLSSRFDRKNYNNDLAFGCLSLGLDFDFQNN